MTKTIKFILFLYAFGILFNGHSQEVTRVTKITIQYGFDQKEYERDSLIYDISKYANGDFEKKVVYSPNDHIPFIILKRTLVDSNQFYKIISLTKYDSTEIIQETYIGDRQIHIITKLQDSSILTSESRRFKRRNKKKILEFIWVDYRENSTVREKLKVNRYLFGIVEIKKWGEYSLEKKGFIYNQKETRIFNKKRSYNLKNNEWHCTQISKYKKSKLKWEIATKSEMDTNYTYDKMGRLKYKVTFKNGEIKYMEAYQYSNMNSIYI